MGFHAEIRYDIHVKAGGISRVDALYAKLTDVAGDKITKYLQENCLGKRIFLNSLASPSAFQVF